MDKAGWIKSGPGGNVVCAAISLTALPLHPRIALLLRVATIADGVMVEADPKATFTFTNPRSGCICSLPDVVIAVVNCAIVHTAWLPNEADVSLLNRVAHVTSGMPSATYTVESNITVNPKSELWNLAEAIELK